MSDDNRLLLKNVILSFPALFEPKSFDDSPDKSRFEASLLIDKDREDVIESIKHAIKETAIEKWNDKVPPAVKQYADNAVCLRDGDMKTYDGYADRMFLACASRTRPTVVDRDRSPVLPEDGRIYAGCVVNAIVSFWAQDNKYGKRVNANIHGVQFVEDGQAFSGAGKPVDPDDFDALETAVADNWDA